MVMHRALFTWFILLVFFVLLCLRLESRTYWNWFIIFLPLWLYDAILLIYALFNIILHCKHGNIKTLHKNKNNMFAVMVTLKVVAQIVVCLRLEYPTLGLSMYHVLIPFWLLLPLLIIDMSFALFKTSTVLLLTS